MKVTLIFPAIGIIGFGCKDYYSGEVSWINHGLASIGATLKKDGHDVDLIDLRRLDGWGEFAKKIKKRKPDVIGISVSSMDLRPAAEAIQIVAKELPKTIIAVGGIQPTMFPEKFVDNPDIDYVVKGEGETAMSNLCSENAEECIENGLVCGVREDLDSLPFIDRELFEYQHEMDNSFILGIQPSPMVTMLAGRGCPYKCAYCQPAENSVFGLPYRMRSVDHVIAELDELKAKYDFKSVLFWDDTFTFNQKWVSEFCKSYKHDAELLVNSRADIICKHPEMVERLAGIGLKTMLIGFESGSQRMLDLMEKGTTVDQNFDAAEICKKNGVKIFGTYMFGLPGETKGDALLTNALIRGTSPEHKLMFIFTPIPGTKLFSYCKENDLLLDQNYDDIARTGVRKKRIKGVDYKMLINTMKA